MQLTFVFELVVCIVLVSYLVMFLLVLGYLFGVIIIVLLVDSFLVEPCICLLLIVFVGLPCFSFWFSCVLCLDLRVV